MELFCGPHEYISVSEEIEIFCRGFGFGSPAWLKMCIGDR